MNTMTGAGARAGRGDKFWTAAAFGLLGVLCTALGIVALSMVSWGQVATHLAARNWPTASATMHSVSLAQVSGGSSRGAGPTWRLQLSATYSYTVEGVSYEGTRASLADVGDLDDRRLKTLYGRLKFAQVTGRALPAAYDPDEPALAYLDTAFPWRSAAAHGGLGLSLMAAGFVFAALFRSSRTRS